MAMDGDVVCRMDGEDASSQLQIFQTLAFEFMQKWFLGSMIAREVARVSINSYNDHAHF